MEEQRFQSGRIILVLLGKVLERCNLLFSSSGWL